MPDIMPEPKSPTDAVIDLFTTEAQRAVQVTPGKLICDPAAAPASFTDYQAACHELIGANEILPESLLQQWLAYIAQDSKLKLHFPEGYECCLAVMPFSTYGNSLPPEEMQRGDYLRILIINPDGKTVSGFSINSSFVADLLPSEVRTLAFSIEKYETEGTYQIAAKDRQRLSSSFEKAFRSLKLLLEKNPPAKTLH